MVCLVQSDAFWQFHLKRKCPWNNDARVDADKSFADCDPEAKNPLKVIVI